jgi:alpha-beta hydrolase superfamily lysophospholipase
LIGHSLGGLVANKYLERFNAPAAILLAPSPVWGMFVPGLKAQISDPLMMLKIALKQDYSVMYSTPERAKKYLFSKDAELAKIADYTEKISPEAYTASLESIFNLPRPRKIRTKMLVLAAGDDAILSTKTMRSTARKLNAEFRIVPNIAHDMMLEANWRDAAETMADWLSSHFDDQRH